MYSFSFRVRLTMSCAKFGVNWARNVGGVAKSLAVFAILHKENTDANGRGL